MYIINYKFPKIDELIRDTSDFKIEKKIVLKLVLCAYPQLNLLQVL